MVPIEYSLRCIIVNPLGCLTRYTLKNKFHAMTLAERLKSARTHAGLTQKELEEKSGVPQQMISKIENGRQETSAYLVNLAVACGVRPEWLAMDLGEMVDGLYVADEKIKRAVLLMQDLPDYAVDEAIKSIDTVAKLTKLGQEANKKK
jgi:transcriptional regulator with XRE-family HTH domain